MPVEVDYPRSAWDVDEPDEPTAFNEEM